MNTDEHGADFEPSLNVLEDLLNVKMREPHLYLIRGINKIEESFTSLNHLFFGWKANANQDEIIIGLIADYG